MLESMLYLYQYENWPFCARARQALIDAEAPAAGIRRAAPGAINAGDPPVPTLIDPNAGQALFTPADIAGHLRAYYA